jgi:glycosyltransferase involved in cell wall biosynthesis
VNKPPLDELPSPPSGKCGWPWTQGDPAVHSLPAAENTRLPRISVVMPSFNQGPFIEASIRSVLLQGYDDLEFIVVDAGSTDETVEIIKKYEPWLSYWVSEPDRGQSDALRKGFARSTGEVLAWLNSDDIYCPGALFSVGQYYSRYPDTGLLYGDSEVIDAQGKVTDSIKGHDGDLKLLLTRNIIPQPSAFFSRYALDKAGGINADLHFIMDYELWIRMMLQGIQLHHIPQILSRFRWYQISKSGSYSTQFGYEYLAFIERTMRYSQDERFLKNRLDAFHYAFTMIMACNRQGAEDQDILKALTLWTNHLEEYRTDYANNPKLWSDSLYRIGDAYCIQGDIRKGRDYFFKSIGVNKINNMALLGWLVSCMGHNLYSKYARTWRGLAMLKRHWR